MKFHLVIECDGAAFTEDGQASRDLEVARRLTNLAIRLRDYGLSNRVLMDTNGNCVGRAWFAED